MKYPTLLFLAIAALSDGAFAQLPSVPNFGPVSELPAGIVVRPDRPLGAPVISSEIQIRPPVGSPTPVPLGASEAFVPWQRTSYRVGPDYSQDALFGASAPLVEIASHSTGNAQVPKVNAQGQLILSIGNRWMGMVVSVDNAAVGLAGSPTARRVSAPSGVRNTPGADLISYYFADSVGIAPSVRGERFIEQSAESFGLGGSTEDREINALDFALGAQSEARAPENAPPFQFFPVRNQYYFSLTLSSAVSLLEAAQFTLPGEPVGRLSALRTADNATIYKMTWDPDAAEWGPVTVHRSSVQLDLTPFDDTVDALSVNEETDVVIYSTQPRVGRSQLMVESGGPSGRFTAPLKNASNMNVVTALGLRDGTVHGTTLNEIDDITSGCPIEPESGSSGIGRLVGTPIEDLPPLFPNQPNMGISLTRSSDLAASDLSNFVAAATGWGGATPEDGEIHFYINLNYGAPDSAFFLFAQKRRASYEESVHAEIEIPSGSPFGRVAVFAIQGGASGLPVAITGMSLISFQN